MSSTTQLRRVALQNKSSRRIGFDDLVPLASALQTQVDRDFFPVWGVRAQIFTLQQDDSVPNGVWPIFFIDPIDEPDHQGAGVHLSPNGQPNAFVTDEGFDSGEWTITASHELLEMLADPLGNRFMQGPNIDPQSDRHLVSFLVEVGDPCEVFPYTINNTLVSDFVTGDYYHAELKNGVYDFLRRLSGPLEVPEPGNYISWQDHEDRHWHQKRPDGSFVTSKDMIDSKKNPREDRDSAFGETEGNVRHDLHRILTAYQQKRKMKVKA
jgi:hypothetical protein